MKKLIIMLTTLLLVVVPLRVSADMSAPVSLEYEAIVTNPNGANLYVYDSETNQLVKSSTLNYNEKI